MSNENNVGTYTRTITTTPNTAELLNYLIDTRVIPVLQKRVVQGSMPRNRKRLSKQEEFESIIEFATGKGR